MRLCLVAWHQLASERPSILGARSVRTANGGSMIVPYSRRGAIPYRAISAWSKRNGLDAEMAELVVDVIGHLDHEREEAAISKESMT